MSEARRSVALPCFDSTRPTDSNWLGSLRPTFPERNAALWACRFAMSMRGNARGRLAFHQLVRAVRQDLVPVMVCRGPKLADFDRGFLSSLDLRSE